MPTFPPFNDKAEVLNYILHYYRAHSSTLSGPTEAITQVWPELRKRLPVKLREQFLLLGLAHAVQRYATSGRTADQGWNASQGYLTVTPLIPNDPTAQGQPIHIPVERQRYEGPQVVYPQILIDTTYVTEAGANALIFFTIEDLRYVAHELQGQQFGLARRQAALRYGAKLLKDHEVATVADLPPEALSVFEARWQQAVQGPKRKEKAA